MGLRRCLIPAGDIIALFIFVGAIFAIVSPPQSRKLIDAASASSPCRGTEERSFETSTEVAYDNTFICIFNSSML